MGAPNPNPLNYTTVQTHTHIYGLRFTFMDGLHSHQRWFQSPDDLYVYLKILAPFLSTCEETTVGWQKVNLKTLSSGEGA
jgi:hypothetical protein